MLRKVPFAFPFFNNHEYSLNHLNEAFKQKKSYKHNSTPNNNISSNTSTKKASQNDNISEAFFEIFGLKLYYDDILIMCILFFLYTEKVKDDELFICLILLLLT